LKKKNKDANLNHLISSILARNKISYKKMTIRTISSYPKVFIWKSFEERKGGGGSGEEKINQNKTKQETVEKSLTGSAVNGMHFSIQVTHPCRTSKTGLESLPILTGSGYYEPLGLS
jgi:hypothetical protein